MKEGFSDFLYFNSNERRGILVLLAVIVATFTAFYLLTNRISHSPKDFEKIKSVIKTWNTSDSLLKQERIEEKEQFKEYAVNREKKVEKNVKTERKKFSFDPNTVSRDSLIVLGFSQFSANNLVKFRSKGGKIKNAEDILKIYGVEKEHYLSLLPYISIDEKSFTASFQNTKSDEFKDSDHDLPQKVLEQHHIDINTANQEEWMALRGIGPKLSERIIKYKNYLGGYASVEQLREVYGLPDSTYENIKPFLSKNGGVKMININHATLDEIKSHPYIDYRKAKQIINYRLQHGHYEQIDDLLKIKVFDKVFIDKIRPYLSVDESTS